MRELPYYNWSYAHPKAIELAAEIASLAPGNLNRVFFVSGGSEAVESAWKLARQYYDARGEKHGKAAAIGPETRHDSLVAARRSPRRYKAIARSLAYHGTTMGVLSINGIPAMRTAFEPLVPEVRHVLNTNRYRRPAAETETEFTKFPLDDLEQAILAMGPETGASSTWSPSRTPAAASPHPTATGRASAPSATPTTSCSPPTR